MFTYLKDLIISNNPQQFSVSFTAKEHAHLSESGANLLHWACAYGRDEIVKILLDAGVSPTILDSTNRNALHYAYNHISTLKIIFQYALAKKEIDLILEILNLQPQVLVSLDDHQDHHKIDPLFQEVQQLLQQTPLEIKWDSAKKSYSIRKQQLNAMSLADLLGNLGIHTRRPTRSLSLQNLNFLVRRYFDLMLGTRKYIRDNLHGAHTPHGHEELRRLLNNCKLLRLAIGFCAPNWTGGSYTQVPEPMLETYLHQQQTQHSNYFSDDLSDDSDDEDNQAIFQRSDRKKIQKLQHDNLVLQRDQRNFWLRTARQKPGNATSIKGRKVNSGLEERLADMVEQHRQDRLSENTILETLNGVPKKGNTKEKPSLSKIIFDNQLTERASIQAGGQALLDLQTLNALIERDGALRAEHLRSVSTTFTVAKYRGLNYMEDRWNTEARRYHRQMDEENMPQYAEMILKSLPTCFYTELSAETDYTKKPELMQHLIAQALKIQAFFKGLAESGPCVDVTDLRGGTEFYLFDNIAERMQHHFSNGIDELLKNFQAYRVQFPQFWGSHLPNALNPFNATSDRPAHTLKYALGLKDYYSFPLLPHYNVDPNTKQVTLEHSHVGKVYSSFHALDEVTGENAVYNVSVMDKDARVQIRSLIAPEKETNFPLFIPGNKVSLDYIIKYPSFNGPWKPIHEIKYGLNASLYQSFKVLIQISSPHTPLRDAVIKLLADWLCSFHEVRLIEVMRERALAQGKQLVYVTREGKLSFTPDSGQLMKNGDDNIPTRNEVHIKRTARKMTAQTLRMNCPANVTSFPGLTLFSSEQAQASMCNLLSPSLSPTFINAAARDVVLTPAEESHRITSGNPSDLPYKTNTILNVMSGVMRRGIFQPSKGGCFMRSPVTEPGAATQSTGHFAKGK